MAHRQSTCLSVNIKVDNYCSDDLLENTKPNLISFSLSTSTSSQTNAADFVGDPNKAENEKERNAVSILSVVSFEQKTTGELFDSPACCGSSYYNRSCFPNDSSRETDTCLNSCACISPIKSEVCFFGSQSSQNLTHCGDPQESLDCFQPLREYCIESDGLSSSSVVVENSKTYGPLTSNYFYLFLDEMWQSDNVQREMEKLQDVLQEQNILLYEIQSECLSLMLENAETKNKIDQLRFTVLGPCCEMRSFQTEMKPSCFSPLLESVVIFDSPNPELFSSLGSSAFMNTSEKTAFKSNLSGGEEIFASHSQKQSIHLVKKNSSRPTRSHSSESTGGSLHCLEDYASGHCVTLSQTDTKVPHYESNILTASWNNAAKMAFPSRDTSEPKCNMNVFQRNGNHYQNLAELLESPSNIRSMLSLRLKKNYVYALHLPNCTTSCQSFNPFFYTQYFDVSTQYKSIENRVKKRSVKLCGTCTFGNRS